MKLKDIVAAEDLPAPFLSSTLQRLVTEGLLRSSRGRTGGYALERDPRDITLFDLKVAIDGTRELEACAVGHAVCSDSTPCPLHDTWKPLRQQIKAYLNETTLADIAMSLEAKMNEKTGQDGD